MEDEKLDNAAFQPNSRTAVPREIDKAASAPNDCLAPDRHVASCSPEQSMDGNQNAALNESAGCNRRSESDLADCSNPSNRSPTRVATVHEPSDGSQGGSINAEVECPISDHNNRSSTDENSVELRPATNEVHENEQANVGTEKQEANGFASEPTIMSNGKLKRKDDQLNETRTSSEDSNSTKKICNNSAKTTPVNSNSLSAANNACTNGKPGRQSN